MTICISRYTRLTTVIQRDEGRGEQRRHAPAFAGDADRAPASAK